MFKSSHIEYFEIVWTWCHMTTDQRGRLTQSVMGCYWVSSYTAWLSYLSWKLTYLFISSCTLFFCFFLFSPKKKKKHSIIKVFQFHLNPKLTPLDFWLFIKLKYRRRDDNKTWCQSLCKMFRSGRSPKIRVSALFNFVNTKLLGTFGTDLVHNSWFKQAKPWNLSICTNFGTFVKKKK